MIKKIIWVVVSVLIVAAIVATVLVKSNPKATVSSNCTRITGSTASITYGSDFQFTPSCIIIPSGTQITWNNQSGKKLDIGADPHPIHTGNKEVSNGQFVLEIESGNQSAVTMQKKGTFGFHDHLHASSHGTISVE